MCDGEPTTKETGGVARNEDYAPEESQLLQYLAQIQEEVAPVFVSILHRLHEQIRNWHNKFHTTLRDTLEVARKPLTEKRLSAKNSWNCMKHKSFSGYIYLYYIWKVIFITTAAQVLERVVQPFDHAKSF